MDWKAHLSSAYEQHLDRSSQAGSPADDGPRFSGHGSPVTHNIYVYTCIGKGDARISKLREMSTRRSIPCV